MATPMISCYTTHTVGLVYNGTVLACGNDSAGQVSGVSAWTDIVAVAAGAYHTLGLKSDGTVVACGDDSYNAVSGVSGWTGIVAIAAGWLHSVGLKSDGTVVACGYDYYDQYVDVSGWTDIVAIGAGHRHSVGLKSDGTVVACGGDSDGQVSGVAGWSGVSNIFAGHYCTVAVYDDGTAAACGRDSSGQITDIPTWTDIIAVDIGDYHTLGLKSDGTVVACGGDSYSAVSGVSGWTDIVAIAAGTSNSFGLDSATSETLAVGKDTYGQVSGVADWVLFAVPLDIEAPTISSVSSASTGIISLILTSAFSSSIFGSVEFSTWRTAQTSAIGVVDLVDANGNALDVLTADIQFSGTNGVSITLSCNEVDAAAWLATAVAPYRLRSDGVDLYRVASVDWERHTGRNRSVVVRSNAIQSQRFSESVSVPAPKSLLPTGSVVVAEIPGAFDVLPGDTVNAADLFATVAASVHIHVSRQKRRTWIYG